MTGAIVAGALLTAAVACFASFAWALRSHFRSDLPTPAAMTALSALSMVAFLWFAAGALAGMPRGAAPAAAVLFALSLLLFWWTIRVSRRHRLTLAFTPDKPSLLLTAGPYRFVRHPFYLSYVLFWCGTAAASAGLAHWLVPAVMAAIYMVAAWQEEAKFAASPLAAKYRAYRVRTGLVLPKLPCARLPRSEPS